MDLGIPNVIAGLLVGTVVGATGVGGGALMTPILVLLFGVDPLAAVSTDVVASLVMKPIGGTAIEDALKRALRVAAGGDPARPCFVVFLTDGLPTVGTGVFATLAGLGAFLAKLGLFLFFFVWVRWTIPRFRYDQVMRLGWNVLLPLAVANLVLTFLYHAFAG